MHACNGPAQRPRLEASAAWRSGSGGGGGGGGGGGIIIIIIIVVVVVIIITPSSSSLAGPLVSLEPAASRPPAYGQIMMFQRPPLAPPNWPALDQHRRPLAPGGSLDDH